MPWIVCELRSLIASRRHATEFKSRHNKEPPRATKKTKGKAAKETTFEATVQNDRDELREHLNALVRKA